MKSNLTGWLHNLQRAFQSTKRTPDNAEIEELRAQIKKLHRRLDNQIRMIKDLTSYIDTLCEVQEPIDHEKFACPICGKCAPAMLPFVRSTNVRCTFCNSLPRHRLFYLVADRVLNLFSKPLGTVLHFAPEKCLQDIFRNKSDMYYSVDIMVSALVNLVVDAQSLPIADQSVDFLYSCHVLEHIPDDQKAMREIARVLKSSGVATIMVPLHGGYQTKDDPEIKSPAQRDLHYGNPVHLRYYGNDVKNQLEAAGLKVERYSKDDVLTKKDTKDYRLLNNVVFICRRGA